eukprot:6201383-Pleurochrysis_carterae.AAC.1
MNCARTAVGGRIRSDVPPAVSLALTVHAWRSRQASESMAQGRSSSDSGVPSRPIASVSPSSTLFTSCRTTLGNAMCGSCSGRSSPPAIRDGTSSHALPKRLTVKEPKLI